MDHYIFKNPIDATAYFVLYILIPFSQGIVCCAFTPNEAPLIILICMLSMLYDCFMRYNTDMDKSAIDKLMIVGVSCVFVIAIAIVFSFLSIKQVDINGAIWLLCTPLAIPTFIAIWDGILSTKYWLSRNL